MSFLPPDLLPGEPYLLGMVTSAGPTQPFFAPASGGGGGSAISTFNQLFASTIGTTNLGNVDLTILAGGANLVFDAPINGQLLDLQFQVSTVIAQGGNAPSIACSDLGSQNYLMSIGAPAGVGMTTSISSLNVSSINGQAPGGGGSAFTSSFLLTIPGGTSSLVMALPAGQYAFMGTALYTGSNNFLSGTASALLNQTSGQWSANVIENPNTGNRPADTGSGCSMILNTWENPLSTAKLYINNVNASPAGDATWVGVIGKLY